MVKIALWIGLVLAFSARSSLLANGGGYLEGGVSETGTITGFTPSGTGAVQIADERLDIAMRPKAAAVEVVYLLQNVTEKNAEVRFGFPVEELDTDAMDGEGPETKPPRRKLEYCRDYRVEWNGKAIKAVFEPEPDATLSNPERHGIRGWLISTIQVPAGKRGTLKIRYLADYPGAEVHVSDDSRIEPKVFRYRLSTGAVWAGPIAKGAVTVRADGIPAEDLKVLAPAGRFEKDDEVWRWEFKDLEPGLADDLEIQAAPDEKRYTRPESGDWADQNTKLVTFIERGGRWFASHANFSKVTASSELAPQKENVYRPENVADGNWDTVWAEGAKGDGRGEWIEASLEVPQRVHAVEILGGYVKSEELFRANARPKRVEIVLDDKHRQTADLPDKAGSVRVPVSGYDKPAERVRVVIKDVYPGARWQDCVVTGLEVTTPMAKAPNVQPAR